ncbi:hypothetical protein [Bradyrhizobium elkanii]
MGRTGNYQIPFDEAGNQLHYPEVWTFVNGKRVTSSGATISRSRQS